MFNIYSQAISIKNIFLPGNFFTHVFFTDIHDLCVSKNLPKYFLAPIHKKAFYYYSGIVKMGVTLVSSNFKHVPGELYKTIEEHVISSGTSDDLINYWEESIKNTID